MINLRSNFIQSCLIGGFCLSSLHFTWLLLVLVGWAGLLMDFVFKVHMLNFPFQVQPFLWALALVRLVITFAFEMFFGFIFQWIKSFFNTPEQGNSFTWT